MRGCKNNRPLPSVTKVLFYSNRLENHLSTAFSHNART